MCGRTSLYAALPRLEERFDAEAALDYRPRYNVAPSQDLATITNADEDTITAQNWGLLPPWADGPTDGPRPINARAETVAEKPTFRDALAERRCLVLADGFYEWRGERGHKQPYRIHLAGDEPFAFAGLWNRWEASGDSLETVTIVTTEANDVVAPIHHRMPVILERDAEREWLRADVDQALDLLDPYAGSDLQAYPISTRVNDASFDDPEVLVEVAAQEQSGLEEFGA